MIFSSDFCDAFSMWWADSWSWLVGSRAESVLIRGSLSSLSDKTVLYEFCWYTEMLHPDVTHYKKMLTHALSLVLHELLIDWRPSAHRNIVPLDFLPFFSSFGLKSSHRLHVFEHSGCLWNCKTSSFSVFILPDSSWSSFFCLLKSYSHKMSSLFCCSDVTKLSEEWFY